MTTACGRRWRLARPVRISWPAAAPPARARRLRLPPPSSPLSLPVTPLPRRYVRARVSVRAPGLTPRGWGHVRGAAAAMLGLSERACARGAGPGRGAGMGEEEGKWGSGEGKSREVARFLRERAGCGMAARRWACWVMVTGARGAGTLRSASSPPACPGPRGKRGGVGRPGEALLAPLPALPPFPRPGPAPPHLSSPRAARAALRSSERRPPHPAGGALRPPLGRTCGSAWDRGPGCRLAKRGRGTSGSASPLGPS